jgi:acyl-CoA dehydrogenase
LTRYSASFAFAADVAMLVLGGGLKRREKLSARLGDVLSLLYLSSAVLKRFEDDGRPVEDEPLMHWAMQDNLFRIQAALDGVLQNFPNRFAAWVLRALIFPIGRRCKPPSDQLGHEVAALLLKPGASRDRLTAGMYLPSDEKDPVGALEAALASTLVCEPIQAGIDKACKDGRIKSRIELEQIAEALKLAIVTSEQAQQLEHDFALRRKVIMVDDFDPAQLKAATL